MNYMEYQFSIYNQPVMPFNFASAMQKGLRAALNGENLYETNTLEPHGKRLLKFGKDNNLPNAMGPGVKYFPKRPKGTLGPISLHNKANDILYKYKHDYGQPLTGHTSFADRKAIRAKKYNEQMAAAQAKKAHKALLNKLY